MIHITNHINYAIQFTQNTAGNLYYCLVYCYVGHDSLHYLHCVSKKRIHLTIGHNFGKCTLISDVNKTFVKTKTKTLGLKTKTKTSIFFKTKTKTFFGQDQGETFYIKAKTKTGLGPLHRLRYNGHKMKTTVYTRHIHKDSRSNLKQLKKNSAEQH